MLPLTNHIHILTHDDNKVNTSPQCLMVCSMKPTVKTMTIPKSVASAVHKLFSNGFLKYLGNEVLTELTI